MLGDINLMLKDGNEEKLEATKRYMAENVDWKTHTKIMLDRVLLTPLSESRLQLFKKLFKRSRLDTDTLKRIAQCQN